MDWDVVSFSGDRHPPQAGTCSQGQGVLSPPANLHPWGGGCPQGSAMSRGHADALGAAALQWHIAGGRGSRCSQGKGIWDPALGRWGCVCTESLSVHTRIPSTLHTRVHTPACMHTSYVRELLESCHHGNPKVHLVLPTDAVCPVAVPARSWGQCRGHEPGRARGASASLEWDRGAQHSPCPCLAPFTNGCHWDHLDL